MTNTTLRPADPVDREFAYHVMRAAFREYVERFCGWDEAAQRALHARRFEAQDVRIIVHGDTDVGYVAVIEDAECVRVTQLFVLPEHQSRGAGRDCMLLVLAEAGRRRIPVRLRVLRVDPRALTFYERLGFRCVRQTDSHDYLEFPAPDIAPGDATAS